MNVNAGHQTAIIAWGSLIGESRDEFDKQHDSWLREGPVLPIEFSRISATRNYALTLVIDPDNGIQTRTWFAISKRKDAEDAACDLRSREGTTIRNIGIYNARTGVICSRWSFIADKVKMWAEMKGFCAVVWTDLISNFVERTGHLFSAQSGVDYVSTLPHEGKSAMRNYFAVVPPEVVTPFRALAHSSACFGEEAQVAERSCP